MKRKINHIFKNFKRFIYQRRPAETPPSGVSTLDKGIDAPIEIPDDYKEKVDKSIKTFSGIISTLYEAIKGFAGLAKVGELFGMEGAKGSSKINAKSLLKELAKELKLSSSLKIEEFDLENPEDLKKLSLVLIFEIAKFLKIPVPKVEGLSLAKDPEKLIYETIVKINRTLGANFEKLIRQHPKIKEMLGKELDLEIFNNDTISTESLGIGFIVVGFKDIDPKHLQQFLSLKEQFKGGKIPYSVIQNLEIENPQAMAKLATKLWSSGKLPKLYRTPGKPDTVDSLDEEEVERRASISRKYLRGDADFFTKAAELLGFEANFESQNNELLLTGIEAAQEFLLRSKAVDWNLNGNYKSMMDIIFGPAMRKSFRIAVFEKGHIKFGKKLVMLEKSLSWKASTSLDYLEENNIELDSLLALAKSLGIPTKGLDLNYDDDLVLLAIDLQRKTFPKEPEQWNGILDFETIDIAQRLGVGKGITNRLVGSKKPAAAPATNNTSKKRPAAKQEHGMSKG